MRRAKPVILIKRRTEELLPLVGLVRGHADSARDSLGFLPEQVYEEAAVQRKLLVAVAVTDSQEEYAGHLLFGGVFPHLRVFQVFVPHRFRRQGIATLLVETLVQEAESFGYLSISARVATDLTPANRFWETNAFRVSRRKFGGTARARAINVRIRELRTPNLFTVLAPPSAVDFRLEARLSERRPTFALDLNVVYDLVRKRCNAEYVNQIFNAALNGVFSLRVTEEFVNELRRTSRAGKPDPILEFALTLPRFPAVPEVDLNNMVQALANEVFPQRASAGRLTSQDRSDLIHLASAIHHKAAGFITGEKAILGCRETLRTTYDLEVIGAAELAELIRPSEWSGEHEFRIARESEIYVCELTESHRKPAEKFLASFGLPSENITNALAPGASGSLRRRLVITSNSTILGLASWDPPHCLRGEMELFLWVDEERVEADAMLDYLIDRAVADASEAGPLVLRWRVEHGQSLTRRAAIAHGFRCSEHSDTPSGETLRKICLGKVVTPENWAHVCARVKEVAKVTLPPTMPQYQGLETSLIVSTPRGDTVTASLEELESLVGPALFLLPGRHGVAVPIRRPFAEELFGGSPQRSLVARHEAALLSERVYYSHRRTLPSLKRGMPIVFYESLRGGGRGVAFAVGRIVRTELRRADDVSRDLKRRGVLTTGLMHRMRYTGLVAVTYFDSIMKMKKPVSLQTLRQMRCIDRSNLVTCRPLREDRLRSLLAAGWADA